MLYVLALMTAERQTTSANSNYPLPSDYLQEPANLSPPSDLTPPLLLVEPAFLTAPIGESKAASIEVRNLAPPGLGAWVIQNTYDPSRASVSECEPNSGLAMVCDPNYERDTILLSGASSAGILGDVTLATIAFKCTVGSSTTLVLEAPLFDEAADAPQSLTPQIGSGRLTCLSGICGDPDNSNAVDSVDALFISWHVAALVNLNSLLQANLANVNGNGAINALDAALILQLEAGLLHSLACKLP
jgi:hypothetical protein